MLPGKKGGMAAFDLADLENEDEDIADAVGDWQDDEMLSKMLRDEWFVENPDRKVFVDAKLNTKRY